jgi:hypothetical protein
MNPIRRTEREYGIVSKPVYNSVSISTNEPKTQLESLETICPISSTIEANFPIWNHIDI